MLIFVDNSQFKSQKTGIQISKNFVCLGKIPSQIPDDSKISLSLLNLNPYLLL